MDIINSLYLNEENINQISDYYRAEGYVTLYDFFDKKKLNHLQNSCFNLKYKKIYHPLKFNYYSAKLEPYNCDYLVSKDILDLLSQLINRDISTIDYQSIKMEWKSYSVLNDEELEIPGIDLIIDISDFWDGDFGGVPVYVDMDGDGLMIPPKRGSLTIVSREKGEQKYFKYVNHHAKRKRFFIIGTIRL